MSGRRGAPSYHLFGLVFLVVLAVVVVLLVFLVVLLVAFGLALVAAAVPVPVLAWMTGPALGFVTAVPRGGDDAA